MVTTAAIDILADYVAKNGAPSAAAPKIFFRYYYVNSSTGAKSGTMLAEVTLFLCLLTSERGPFRALKMRPVRQEAVHSLWSRLFCGTLKMRRVPQEAVFVTEYLFRTVEAYFLHRMLPKMRRVPEKAVFYTECF